ncbi:MAG: hypothetical protein AAGC95_00950 [Pseudomonadota bacterium]
MSVLREIGAIYDPEEACVAFSFLSAHGFNPQIANYDFLFLAPTHRIALGGFRLLVPGSESEDAFALFQTARKAPNRAGPACPACGGEDYRRIKGWLFPALFFFLFATIVPFVWNTGYLECRCCKTRIPRDYTRKQEPV